MVVQSAAPERMPCAMVAPCCWANDHTRRRKRCAPSTPDSDHSTVCSGGLANITNRRAVSAPMESMSDCGSTPLFLDLDMVPMPPYCTAEPSARSLAPVMAPLLSYWFSTSSGQKYSMPPCAFLHE